MRKLHRFRWNCFETHPGVLTIFWFVYKNTNVNVSVLDAWIWFKMTRKLVNNVCLFSYSLEWQLLRSWCRTYLSQTLLQMYALTLVLLFIIRIRFPANLSIAQIITSRYGQATLQLVRKFESTDLKYKKCELDIDFLNTCLKRELLPTFVRFKSLKLPVTWVENG